jgi:2,4-dienoyl-CoA reductase-like NADH-dependent reductase (Old Yellow Enzyme family)
MPCQKNIDDPRDEAYFFEFTRALSAEVPVILTGGHRSLGHMASVLEDPRIELLGLARPLIREPELPTRWRSGEGGEEATCISCNRCLGILGEEPTHCVYQELLDRGEVA